MLFIEGRLFLAKQLKSRNDKRIELQLMFIYAESRLQNFSRASYIIARDPHVIVLL